MVLDFLDYVAFLTKGSPMPSLSAGDRLVRLKDNPRKWYRLQRLGGRNSRLQHVDLATGKYSLGPSFLVANSRLTEPIAFSVEMNKEETPAGALVKAAVRGANSFCLQEALPVCGLVLRGHTISLWSWLRCIWRAVVWFSETTGQSLWRLHRWEDETR